jgi:hypothetical protein
MQNIQGKMYKSTDAGATWNNIGTYDGWDIYIEPTNPDVMLMSTGDYDQDGDGNFEGYMRSLDGGATWHSIHHKAPFAFSWKFEYGGVPGRVFIYNMAYAYVDNIQIEEFTGEQVEVKEAFQPRINLMGGINVAAYPNPVINAATISYNISGNRTPVSVAIYDVNGKKVRNLYSGRQAADRYDLAWDGKNDYGRSVAGSMYYVKVKAGEQQATKRIVVQK